MAGSGVSAGHNTRVNFLWEDAGFAASPNDSTYKTFGSDVTLDTAEGSNAVQRVFMPGQRTGIDNLALFFEGSFSVSFSLTNPWWIRALFGSPSSTDNADGSYTYTYDGKTPNSLRIVEGEENSGAERLLKGCVVTRATVECNVEEEVQVTVEGAYADEEVTTPASLTAQTQPDTKPLTFSDASIALDGTVEGYVQNLSITLAANVDLIREMGSRTAIDFNEKQLEPDVSFGQIFDGSTDTLEAAYGGATTVQEDVENQVKVDVTFDNGEAAGSGINQHIWTLTGTLSDTYGQSGIGEPTADLEESIDRVGLDVTAEATNETSTAP